MPLKNAQPGSPDSPMDVGRVYTGTVTKADANFKTYTVNIAGYNAPLLNCQWGAGIVSGMIGLNAAYIIPEGTRVAVVPGVPNIIVGAYNHVLGDPALKKRHAATTEREARTTLEVFDTSASPAAPQRDGGDTPSDLLPGELDLTNLFGVGIQLLMNFSKLCAGEGAKVEAHLLNDMVRIVSTVFRQHSAFGDTEIYDDGRLNIETHGTSYPHEAWGVASNLSEKLPSSVSGVPKVESLDDLGRWRFSEYKGFIGGFINTFVTDPIGVLASAADAQGRSGKFRQYIGNDGTMLMQSVAEIAFERVHRIPVPQRLLRHDDPTGVKVADYEKLNSEFLKLNKQPKDPLDMFQTAFQLREYARYLSQYQSLARFHQLADKKEFKISSEAEIPSPAWTSEEADVNAANPTLQIPYYDTYATIRIMKDGSILTWAGDGGCVMQSHGDLYACAPRNVTIEAGGDIRLLAGQNIHVKARRNIEITSVIGGIKIKARAYWQALCELGTLWLKSDAYDPKLNPDIPVGTDDPKIVYNDAAILLESSRGRTTIDSNRTLLLATTGNAADSNTDDTNNSILIQSSKHVNITGEKGVSLFSSAGFILLESIKNSIFLNAKYLFGTISKSFQINRTFEIGEGGLTKIRTLRAGEVSATSSVQTGSGKVGKLPEDKRPLGFVWPFDPAVPTYDDLNSFIEDQLRPHKRVVNPMFPFKGTLIFKFDSFTDYVRDPKAFYESLSQQWLRLDAGTSPWSGDWTSGTPAGEKLLAARNVLYSTAPFPGVNAQFYTHTSEESLRIPSNKKGKDLNNITDIKRVPYTFYYLNLSSKYNS